MKLNVIKKFRPGKTWVVLGIALLIGLLAALAARSYLQRQMQEIEDRKSSKTINLVVAKADIKKGSKLTADNLAVRPIPIEYAHSTALRPDEFGQIEGQTIASDMKSGEMILWGLLDEKKPLAFSSHVVAGRRAMTVPVDEVNSISGMLEPGDTVDIMVNLTQKGKKLIFPILRGAVVMATGQRHAADPKSGERKEYSTVTLNVTEQEATHLIAAREVGKLTALLRNPMDKHIPERDDFDVAAAIGLTNSADQENQIPVLYGGAGAKIPPESLRLSSYPEKSNAGP